MSTGVRGKTTITTKDTTLEALDHDLYKSSLTPNVVLKIKVPETPDKSFVQGLRYYIRYETIIHSDGGTDQQNTLESVKIATICLWKDLDLDMIITGRCAPGHSFTNPAERIMSILNLVLQNVATERSKGNDDFAKEIKSCNSMQQIRDKNEKVDSGMVKGEWENSVCPVQQIISDRFFTIKSEGGKLRICTYSN